MKQPRKDVLREQLALAATEIIGLRNEIGALDWLITELKRPWWIRAWDRRPMWWPI